MTEKKLHERFTKEDFDYLNKIVKETIFISLWHFWLERKIADYQKYGEVHEVTKQLIKEFKVFCAENFKYQDSLDDEL